MGKRSSQTWQRKNSGEAKFHRMLSSREKPEGSTLPIVKWSDLDEKTKEQIRQQRETPRSVLNVAYDYPDFVERMHKPSKNVTVKPFDHDKINPHDKKRGG